MHDDRDRGPLRWRRTRLALYLAAIAMASTLWLAERAQAELSEQALSLGRQLDRMSALAAGTTVFELNGARMALTTITREESIEVLLDRFASLCARDSGGVSAQLEELGERVPASLRRGSFGVLRSEREAEGTGACFARVDGGGLMETVRRIGLAVESGDLAQLGQLRAIFVKKNGERQSHVLSVSSLGALPVARMFPSAGDAPGHDLRFGVRPGAARRLISARVEGSKLETAIYESALSPAAALAGFDAPMRSQGFFAGDLSAVRDSLIAQTRLFLRADETVLVIAEPRGAHSTVSSFRLQNGGFVTLPLP